jgi:hypothetical protein
MGNSALENFERFMCVWWEFDGLKLRNTADIIAQGDSPRHVDPYDKFNQFT